jgi:hypothetical protein
LLLFQLFDLTPLALEFPILLLYLSLRLCLLGFLVLEFVTDRIAAQAAERTADRRARARRPHCGTDDRTGTGA